MIRSSRHVIAVQDLERSARYYREVLGFEVRTVGDPGWRFLLRDGCFIMAGECRDALPPAQLGDHSYFAYLEVDAIDALYAELAERRAELVKPLRDEPWGMREFGIRTVDGHRIMFGSRTLHRHPQEAQVRRLLEESRLPSPHLAAGHLEHFFGCGPRDAPEGVVGLEIYGEAALLRSLAVSRHCRGKGYGKALVAEAEAYAVSQGVMELYLLTASAEGFFAGLGYARVERERAPEAIRRTEEFSSLCPAGAAFMVKALGRP